MTLKPHPEVLVTPVDGGGAVLFHLESRATFTLNPTGLRIWQLLAQEGDASNVAAALAAEFEVEAGRAARSVERLCAELVAHDLLVTDDG